MQKPIIDARQALQDIQSGMDDSTLMRKYNLSTKGLKSLFNKLAAAGLIREINPRELIRDIGFGISDSRAQGKIQTFLRRTRPIIKRSRRFWSAPCCSATENPARQSDHSYGEKLSMISGEEFPNLS